MSTTYVMPVGVHQMIVSAAYKLRGYTAEDYAMINRALRATDAEAEVARLQPYLENLKAGLDRFPEFKGVVTRTESNTHMLYEPGETVTMQGFTSTCGPFGSGIAMSAIAAPPV